MELDQYYTRPETAWKYFELVSHMGSQNTLWLEPSAGTGAFYSLFPHNRLGYDLDPKFDGVIKDNFLTTDLSLLQDRDIVTVGNPPFGKNANLAVQFFNRCAGISRVVAMILPRTFRKPSIINRLDRSFHLAMDETLLPFSFIADGELYDVPCCFQVWTKQAVDRALIATPTTHADFIFCKREDGDFAVQRVGAAAGKVKDITNQFKDPSHYFIKARVSGVREIMTGLDFTSVKYETAGNPSVSKGELIALYMDAKG